MIEIAGSRTLVTFDGRVLELFSYRSSRRIHIEQILAAEVHRGSLMVGDGAILELQLVDGQAIAVPFAAVHHEELERLVAALPVPT